MKKLVQFALGAFVAAALGFGALATASAYYGWNPLTGLEVTHGVLVDGGTTAPVISGTCGTRGTVVAAAAHGTVVAGAVTTCTTTLTFATAAPNGYLCGFKDLTTPADSIPQASFTTTSCTSTAATIVSGDTIAFSAEGF